MYTAKGNEIYIKQTDKDTEELFLTVHPTDTGGNMTVEEQAEVLANILNEVHR